MKLTKSQESKNELIYINRKLFETNQKLIREVEKTQKNEKRQESVRPESQGKTEMEYQLW